MEVGVGLEERWERVSSSIKEVSVGSFWGVGGREEEEEERREREEMG